MADVLQSVCRFAAELAARADASDLIAQRYRLQAQDVRAWLGATRWTSRPGVSIGRLSRAVEALRDLGLIARGVQAGELIAALPSR